MSFTREEITAPVLSDFCYDADAAIKNMKVDLQERMNAVIPVGLIIESPVETIPNGWLECNGASLLRSDYPTLFAIIGTTFGAADGTHFNLPDLRGYFVRGMDGRTPATLSIGTTKSRVAHGALSYTIAGLLYDKAADAVGVALPASTIPKDHYGVFGFQINAAGVISVVKGADNSTGYDNEAYALSSCPDADEGNVLYGAITVISTATGGFVAGTTLLDATGVTVKYWKFNTGPDPGTFNQILSSTTNGAATIPFARSDTTGHRAFWRDIKVGSAITGTGIPANTTVQAIDATEITMSANATADGQVQISITDSLGLPQLDSFEAHRHGFKGGADFSWLVFLLDNQYANSSAYGGNETRPININAAYIIRADTI